MSMISQGAPGMRPSSVAKRRAILAAAEEAFLAAHYDSVTMDDLANSSGVSKQTVYAHFGTKEQLFIELVTSMTAGAGDNLDELDGIPDDEADLAPYFMQYAIDEMQIVMTPRLLRLRRLVIGEVSRFPELAQALFENGPQRSVQSLTIVISKLVQRGLLTAPSPVVAATTLNWLVLAAPINETMLLGDGAIPTTAAMKTHAAEATRVFLTAYATNTGRDDLR